MLKYIERRTPAFPHELSGDARARGRRRFRLFMMSNAVPVAFLMEHVLALYAIRNGLSDSLVAVLVSFIHITMPFMLLGTFLIARIGLARSWGLCWSMRYVSALVMATAPFLPSDPGWLRPMVILAGGFGFAMFRSIGALNNHPLVGEITEELGRGHYIFGNMARFNAVYLVSLATASFVMSRFEAVWVYQVMIAVGSAVGFFGSYVLTTIPESRTPSATAGPAIIRTLPHVLADPALRRQLGAWAAGITAFVLVNPFAIVLVKNGYGIPDSTAMLFTLIIVAGGIVSAFVNGRLADRIGPGHLLVAFAGILFAVSVFWAAAPAAFLPVLSGAMFFAGGVAKTGILVGLQHYLLSTVRAERRVEMGLWSEIVAGSVAGLAGLVVAAGLLRVFGDLYTGLAVYRSYFRVVAVLLAGGVLLMLRLPPAGAGPAERPTRPRRRSPE
jgi:hypothetical protein